MDFRARLKECPIFFEVVPPLVKENDHGAAAQEVVEILDGLHVDAINIPEIKSGGPERLDPVAYTRILRERIPTSYVTNKVVAHLRNGELRSWLDDMESAAVEGVVVVGGERSNIFYPGPSVLEADRAVKDRLADITLGNITIQTRRNEERKILDKTLIGAGFFTSQVCYESDTPKTLLLRYQELCRLFDVEPATLVFGLSHVGSRQDIEFLRVLGVNIPEEVDNFLLAGPEGVEFRSMEKTLEVWADIVEFKRDHVPDVPIGATIEPILKRNNETCAEITDAVTRIALRAGIKKGIDGPRVKAKA